MGTGHLGESFVARVWLESRSNGDPVWRGHIRHIQSDAERHFGDLEELREFTERLTGVPWAQEPSDRAEGSTLGGSGRPSKGELRWR